MALKRHSLASLDFKSIVDGSSDFWTASVGGTNEYYYNQTDVPIKPMSVIINGTAATEGTVSSLATGEWGWGNADTLLAPTIYVRLSDETDPDTKAADYVECTEPKTVFTAATAKETIVLSILISNTEASTADVVLTITDASDIAKSVIMFDILTTDSVVSFTEKIVMEATDKLKIFSNLELVNIYVSIAEV